MEILYWTAIFICSLFVLIKSAQYFIDSAETISLGFNISPFIVGVTIVALGTSIPELVSSFFAAKNGSSEIVIGNVVGSNISNILLILGTTFLIQKNITLDFKKQKWDYFILLATAILISYFVFDLHFSTTEAITCIIFLCGYILYTVLYHKNDKNESEKMTPDTSIQWVTFVIGALSSLLIFLSAKYTIVSVKELAILLNISPEIIALTAVSLGTSLPELVVSIVAAKKGMSNIIIGNIIGSNIFNTFAVMGIPFFVNKHLVIPKEIINFSIPVMLLATFLFFLLAVRKKANTSNGILFILMYILFIVGVVLNINIL